MDQYQPILLIQNSPISKFLAKYKNLDRRQKHISDTIKQLLLTTGAAIFISQERRKSNEMFTEIQVGKITPEGDA